MTDMEIRNNVMKVLIECRNEKGLTQAELAYPPIKTLDTLLDTFIQL